LYLALEDTFSRLQLKPPSNNSLIAGYTYKYNSLGNLTEVHNSTGNYLLMKYTYDTRLLSEIL